jgi:hypothetical protein
MIDDVCALIAEAEAQGLQGAVLTLDQLRAVLRELERGAWKRWKGDGPEPPLWEAIHPDTGETHIIGRSNEDYCDD